MLQHLVELVEAAHLDLNLQVEILLLEVSMATVDGIVDAAGEVDMVVLQENHVEETDAMVHAAANLHSLLFEHTHARSGLASVEDVGLGTFEALHILGSHGGDAAHALHDVEHEALSLEQRASLALHDHGDVALLHVGTVLDEHLHLHGRVEAGEHLLRNLYTCQHAIFLDEQVALTHGVLWDTTQGCVVAITDILSKCQVYQLIFQLIYA